MPRSGVKLRSHQAWQQASLLTSHLAVPLLLVFWVDQSWDLRPTWRIQTDLISNYQINHIFIFNDSFLFLFILQIRSCAQTSWVEGGHLRGATVPAC